MNHPVLVLSYNGNGSQKKITIKPAPNNLQLPQDKQKQHPLYKNLTLTGDLTNWK